MSNVILVLELEMVCSVPLCEIPELLYNSTSILSFSIVVEGFGGIMRQGFGGLD